MSTPSLTEGMAYREVLKAEYAKLLQERRDCCASCALSVLNGGSCDAVNAIVEKAKFGKADQIMALSDNEIIVNKSILNGRAAKMTCTPVPIQRQ